MTYLQGTHTVHRDGEYVRTQLNRITNKSAKNKSEVFTSLYHLLNVEMFKQCYQELKGNKAYGIDEITKKEYGMHLEENLKRLVEKLKITPTSRSRQEGYTYRKETGMYVLWEYHVLRIN